MNRRYEWQPHTGDVMPATLRRRTRVDVMRADGTIDRDTIAWGWNWGEIDARILAYRLTRRDAQRCPVTGKFYS